MSRATMTVEKLRELVAAEVAKEKPLGLFTFCRLIRVSPGTVRKYAADLWNRRFTHYTTIYSIKHNKHSARIPGFILQGAGARPGSVISMKVSGGKIIVTHTPGCLSQCVYGARRKSRAELLTPTV